MGFVKRAQENKMFKKIKNSKNRIPHVLWLSAIGFVALATIFIFTGSRYDYLQIVLGGRFPSNDVLLAKVVSVQESTTTLGSTPGWVDAVWIQFLTGSAPGGQAVIHNRGVTSGDPAQKVRPGETIILARNNSMEGPDAYYMVDKYRLPALLFLSLIFVLAIMVFGGMRGLTSLVGLLASVAILMLFVVPRILGGSDPLTVCVSGAVFIAVLSLYLAHGFNKRTTVALAGTLITLGIAVGLTVLFTAMTHLLGIADESTATLKVMDAAIDLRGLFLGGVIIGMLGILDDVTIGQVTAVEEIDDAAEHRLGFKELYQRGTSVGREHIASLVNTLVLAYAGVSFPLLLLLIIQSHAETVPLWLAVNGEPIAEDIVRAIVGSLALILAVPITTFLAAWIFEKKNGPTL